MQQIQKLQLNAVNVDQSNLDRKDQIRNRSIKALNFRKITQCVVTKFKLNLSSL
jgi:hypothetical protein